MITLFFPPCFIFFSPMFSAFFLQITNIHKHKYVCTYIYYSNVLDLHKIRVTQDLPDENNCICHRAHIFIYNVAQKIFKLEMINLLQAQQEQWSFCILWLSEIGHVECWTFSVAANIVVLIVFRVSVLRSLRSLCINLVLGRGLRWSYDGQNW
jgi:hypothetical protein